MRFDLLAVVGIPRDRLLPEQWARLRRAARRSVHVSRDAWQRRGGPGGADGILVDIGLKLDAEALRRMPRLRYIGVFGTGCEAIDLRAAAARDIVVANVPGYATEAVAEFTIAAVLAELRHLPAAAERARQGDLSEGSLGSELRGRKFGVVGMGKIGRRVAAIANLGFEAQVFYWCRGPAPAADGLGRRVGRLDDLLATCEIVSLHLALNEGTRGLLDRRRLGLMREGRLLMNFSPMGLIDTASLLDTLRSRGLTLVLDHADELDPRTLRQLVRTGACRVYPPIGYTTAEAQAARATIFVGNALEFLRHRRS